MVKQLSYAPTKGKSDPRKGKLSSPQVIQMILQEAKNRGLTWFKPLHAAGMAGSFAQETGNFRNDVINFSVRGDGGSAHGLMQWRGARYNNLISFSKGRNLNPADIRTQVAFAFEEGQSGSPYADQGSVRAFKEFPTAKNEADAAVQFIHAERPAGYDGNANNANDASNRVKLAGQAYGAFTGSDPVDRGYQGTDNTFASGGYDATTGTMTGRGYDNNPSRNGQPQMGLDPLLNNRKYGADLNDVANEADKFGLNAFINDQSNNPFLVQQQKAGRGKYDAFGVN